MFVFGLSTLALIQSIWDDPAPKGRWAAGTAQLASELLPPDMAKDAVSHVVSRGITEGGPPSAVRFEGRTLRTEDGFCVRKWYYVSIHSQPGSTEGDPQAPTVGDKIRIGGCDGLFAHVNPGAALDESKRVLRWLDWAVGIARGSGSMPFTLGCRDEPRHGKCAAGVRAALANLPLGKTFSITRDFRGRPHHWDVSVVETAPGQLYWNVKIDATPGQASIDLAWRLPAPF